MINIDNNIISFPDFLNFGTKDEIIEVKIDEYLQGIDKDLVYDLKEISAGIIRNINEAFEKSNRFCHTKYKFIERLDTASVAQILLHLKEFAAIQESEDNPSGNYLTVYCDSGRNEGLYMHDDDYIDRLILKLNRCASEKDRKEIRKLLLLNAPVKSRNNDTDLVAVANGIYDCKNHKLLPFSPEYVFLSKTVVAYNPFATNSTFSFESDDGVYERWDVEEWLLDISNNDENVKTLLLQIIASCIKNIRVDKFIVLQGEKGCGGKSTFCQLLRNFFSSQYCASLNLKQLSKGDSMLAQLVNKSICISDENVTNVEFDDASVLKAITTGDIITINPKYQACFSYRYTGKVIACANSLLSFKHETSDSLYRRYLPVPFNRCYTGAEDKSIKEVKIADSRVLEYLLYKVLHMDFDEFIMPEVCKKELDKIKMESSPVRMFWDEYRITFAWDFLPQSFLRDAFNAYYKTLNPGHLVISNNEFKHELMNIVHDDPEWDYREGKIRPGNMMNEPEYLIAELGLENWASSTYKGPDYSKYCVPTLKYQYVGGVARKAEYVEARKEAAKAEAEAKAKAMEEARAKAIAEQMAREEATRAKEAKAKAEAEARAKAKAKAEAEAKAKAKVKLRLKVE